MTRPSSNVGAGAAQEWQPIENAPKDGTPILLWDGFSVFEGFNNWSLEDGKRHDRWQTAALEDRVWVSHWMPLPTPPAGETK